MTPPGQANKRGRGTSCSLELGIFASHLVWLWRTRSIRKEAALSGKTFDQVAAEHEQQGVPFEFAERKSRVEKPDDQDTEACTGSSPEEL